MTFMLNYTDPFLESVSDAFALSEAHAEPPEELQGSSCRPASFLCDDYIADLFPGIYLDLYMDQDKGVGDPTPTTNPLPPSPTMQHRIEALLPLLLAQYELSPSEFPLLTERFPMELATVVFTSDHISEYVSAFFNFFHPHTPFLHRPSFNMEHVSLHLLLAVLLVGSIFCAPQDHALSARCFFGLGEKYVFGLLRELVTHNRCSSDDSVTTVQAAILIHALHVNSNHEGVRHRFRVNCFPEIVASMRCLGLFGFTRTQTLEIASWEQYINDEVRIRYAL
jgi:hypothetical protein